MSAPAEFHGRDTAGLRAALDRAVAIAGIVVKSRPPEETDDGGGPGYWSDSCAFVRAWERLVWSSEGGTERLTDARRRAIEEEETP